jgi:dCMP deaminase
MGHGKWRRLIDRLRGGVDMRPSVDNYFIDMAKLVATRGTCIRRKVGCVLVNKRNHVIATGYNGVAAGFTHCLDHPCPGADQPSGSGLDMCEASHAEQSALLQCRDVYEIHTLYSTTSPCIQCIKLLLNTSCQRIVFAEEYPHGISKQLWLSAGREWVQHGAEVQETNTQPESVAIIRT